MFLESFDKTKIYYRIKRKSDLFLIFVHGWAQNWTAWKKEINFFQEKGYSTLALDLRGHGLSDKPEKKRQYRLKCFAKDIRRIIKKEKIKQYVLIGHSMGGMISLVYYKLFNKKINALVLCSTTAENVLEHKKIRALSPFIKHV
ncbi:alpha/beta hydrolase, partial [Candidatus Woesearchaeota archaeon]|nr:alpha/beta hydrolase [Candidatus Woesearchaeota archaeon]